MDLESKIVYEKWLNEEFAKELTNMYKDYKSKWFNTEYWHLMKHSLNFPYCLINDSSGEGKIIKYALEILRNELYKYFEKIISIKKNKEFLKDLYIFFDSIYNIIKENLDNDDESFDISNYLIHWNEKVKRLNEFELKGKLDLNFENFDKKLKEIREQLQRFFG